MIFRISPKTKLYECVFLITNIIIPHFWSVQDCPLNDLMRMVESTTYLTYPFENLANCRSNEVRYNNYHNVCRLSRLLGLAFLC